jgi:replication initiation protein RepC
LVQTGFLVRRDSPNGKRFARRYGDERVAFGFDLTPLLTRFHEVCQMAEEVRAEEEVYQRVRQTVSLMKRDLKGLADYGRTVQPDLGLWDECDDVWILVTRDLRRALPLSDLRAWEAKVYDALVRARDVLEPEKMSTSDAANEQHHQNSNIKIQESDHPLERVCGGKQDAPENSHEPDSLDNTILDEERRLPNIPLGLVLSACTEFKTYVPDRIRHWHDFVNAAEILRPMMGISPSAWNEAIQAMGPEEASIVMVAMLERFSEIKSPGGYLRHLARKAEKGQFSSGPMVMSLMRKAA